MLARPGLPEFEYIKAESPQDVFRLLKEKGDEIKLLMGGTDLFIQMRDRSEGADILLDLKHIPGMRDITYDKKEGITIGAAATLNQISAHEDIQSYFQVLGQSADTVGNYQLRNRATLGGNICNASPSADLAPAALVLEGKVALSGASGDRTIPVDEFWVGPGKTALKEYEFMTAVHFPNPPKDAVGQYIKLGRSKMGDLAIVGVAVLGFPDPEVPAGFRFRIAVNSTAPTAYRVPEAEEFLTQAPLSNEILRQASEKAMEVSAPIEDVRATVLYQKKMVNNLVFKGLNEIWGLLKDKD
ncbi:MAG: xanthine dehydrogenase family protein subunit M [Anaerolineales bacterium]|nr:xanthine dehydrogenase family protein subunit M [Anaerolineales bacterium]